MASRSTGRGNPRLMGKLTESIANGNLYEAHQIYRTLYFRQKAAGQYEQTLPMMYSGALTMCNGKQFDSAADLSLLYLDILCSGNFKVDEKRLEEVSNLHCSFHKSSPERERFVKIAVDHFKLKAPELSPKLNENFGLCYWRERQYRLSHHHLLHSGVIGSNSMGVMLAEMSKCATYPTESDLLIMLIVLQYLSIKCPDGAAKVLKSYCSSNPDIGSDIPSKFPLINAAHLLLKVCHHDTPCRKDALILLMEKYKNQLNRDCRYAKYLTKIAEIYFGIHEAAPRHQGFGGIFGNLMSSMFSVGDQPPPVLSNGQEMNPRGNANPSDPMLD